MRLKIADASGTTPLKTDDHIGRGLRQEQANICGFYFILPESKNLNPLQNLPITIRNQQTSGHFISPLAWAIHPNTRLKMLFLIVSYLTFFQMFRIIIK